MTGPRLIVGVDPGPIPGIAGLFNASVAETTWEEVAFSFAQCDYMTLADVLDAWCDPFSSDNILIATETYVVGNRASRSAHSHAREMTQYVLERVKVFADKRGATRVTRPAGIVKPWATNERLDTQGFVNKTVGCTHARDATRHMLYAAVHDGGYPDPLSEKAR